MVARATGCPAVTKIDAGGFHGRLAVLDVCLNLLEGGGGVVVILLADCAFGPKLLEAFFLELDGGQLRFGAGKRGFRVFKGRLVQGGIDLKKRLAGFDFGAFRKEAFLDYAAHLGTDLGNQVRGRPPRQFGGHHHRLLFNRGISDFRRRRLAARIGITATAQKKKNN